MKALVLYAIDDLRFEDVPVPQPDKGEVLVRVSACGVCGSDIPRLFEKGAYRFPIICGHEFSGTIASCGEGVNDLAVGTPVTVFPLIWCDACPACEQGHYAQCHHYDYLGSRRNGAFAEYVAAPRRNILPVPRGVSPEVAAMTEPAAVALHAVKRAGGVAAGETVVVMGAGPIGLMTAQWAAISGAGNVILFDVAPDKLDLARQLGFQNCFNPLESSPHSVIEDLTSGLGAEIAIEAAGVPSALNSCLSVTGRHGRVVLLGNPSADVLLPAPLLSRIMRNEISLYGTWNSEFSALGNLDDWRVVLQAAEKGILHLAPLISHRTPLPHAVELLTAMHQRSITFSKVLLQP